MANILCHDNQLIVGLNRKIYFIDTNTFSIVKSLIIPEILPRVDSEKQIEDKSLEEKLTRNNLPTIQHVNISRSGELLAVTLTRKKYLLLYKIQNNYLTLLSQRPLHRVSSALTFSSNSSKLLICDKTGDCYLFDCLDYKKPGEWILGHLSIVMDVKFSRNQKFIITSDRDEKIRVTNFPNTYEIERYCLGHTEYVSYIDFLPFEPNEYLLSLSGDKSLRIWEYIKGIELYKIEIPAPGVKVSLQQVSECVCHAAVLIYQPKNNVLVYEIRKEIEFESKLIKTYCFDPAIVTNLVYIEKNLILTISKDAKFNLEVVSELNNSPNFNILKETLNDLYKDDEYAELEDISQWFKKKFDNVSEYLERKKRRIEEKFFR